jgi:malonyl CoA-acyl carrier protein transacylase
MEFQIIALNPTGFAGVRLVRAACTAGFLGALDIEHSSEEEIGPLIQALIRSNVQFAVLVGELSPSRFQFIESALGRGLRQVILSVEQTNLKALVSSLRRHGIQVLVEIINRTDLDAAESAVPDGIVVKGNECGGSVGEEATFVLLQGVLAEAKIPVYARGGIGVRTAAACLAAGAAGVLLDWQLALCEESELPENVKAKVRRLDGSETAILGQDSGRLYRAYSRPGETAYAELRSEEERIRAENDWEALDRWRSAIQKRAIKRELLLIGQDGSFASGLAEDYRTVSGICSAIRHEAIRQCRVAARLDILRENGPLAAANGTRYPIVQGPMTRVSDRADFALSVAKGGGLPFLALALLRGPEVAALLHETKEKLGTHPWGVGILGFVPKELKDEQLAEVMKSPPKFAIIAGGRPDQAKLLQEHGIDSYLHVPSPELLRSFLEEGVRRVIFEGRECGGHVGPRTSFVLWETMVRVILNHLSKPAFEGKGGEYHVLFAGGVHDALSAAMVAALSASLAERGVKIGILMGTAYLFTYEVVTDGAITHNFQQEAIGCEETVLLETGVGHATRCVRTPFYDHFLQEKRRLVQERCSKEEIRERLEKLNLGRLRIAAKGLVRAEQDSGQRYQIIDAVSQRREGMYMIGQVAALRHRVCRIEELHSQVSGCNTVLRKRLNIDTVRRVAASRADSPSDIAIIGISCLLPHAESRDQFWQNILNRVNAVEEVPDKRWKTELYFDPDRRAKDKVYSRWGGFLKDVPFDPARYGMPPNSVASIEPLQLLTLELVREALADAGYNQRVFNRERTSVVVGTGGGAGDLGTAYSFRTMLPHYLERAGINPGEVADIVNRLNGYLPEWSEDSFAGYLLNVVAGRIANRFDLGGANYTVDAACGTSLAALRLAVGELESGSCDMTILAASDLLQSPMAYMSFAKTQALSPTGQCRTFDETADGIVISEGIAVAVLKRLDDAVQDGDKIYAVIKGVGASSDGRDKAIATPRPIGQIRALDRAYTKAGVPPSTVGLIEAHGTGTAVGDKTEVESLSSYFRGLDRQSCALGSVKSMIGHTKNTAGLAGMIKAVLALHHKVLPPTIGVTKPNSKAKFESTPFYINTETRSWFEDPDHSPRRAGVSAFGFGGTNYHAVLEEFDATSDGTEATLKDWPAELFLWRGKSGDEILKAVDLIQTAILQGAEPRLCDLAAAVYWECGGGDGVYSLAIVADSLEDLRSKLDAAKVSIQSQVPLQDPRGIYYSSAAPGRDAKVAFLFSGQGSQRVNMLRDLALAFPVVRKTFESADQVLGDQLGSRLTEIIFPRPAFTPQDKEAQEQALKATRVAQPALGAADMAICRLLAQLDIRPDLACGHSYGEFAALGAAGVFSFEDLIRVSEARGRLIVEVAKDEPGTMAAVDATEIQLRDLLKDISGVWIANLNSPSQTVISGTEAGVASAIAKLKSANIAAKLIPVACAFHSDLVAGAKEPLRKALGDYPINSPSFPVFSNTTARPHSTDTAEIRDLLSAHLAQPVRFSDEILGMYESGARIFIEIGPGRVLTNLVTQTLGSRSFVATAMDHSNRNGLFQLTHSLAQLFITGLPFLAYQLFNGRASKKTNLSRLLDQTKPVTPSPTTWMISAGQAIPLRTYQRQTSAPGQNRNSWEQPVGSRLAITPIQSSKGETVMVERASLAKPAEASGASAQPTSSTNGVANQLEQKTVSTNDEDFRVNSKRQPTNVTAKIDSMNKPPQSQDSNRRLPEPSAVHTSSQRAIEAAIQEHHQVMSKFLDTHRSVMLAYLGGTDKSAQPKQEIPATELPQLRNGEPSNVNRSELASAVKAQKHPQSALADATPTENQLPNSNTPTLHYPGLEHEDGLSDVALRPSAANSVDQRSRKHEHDMPHEQARIVEDEVGKALLDIVAERTGYPRETLDLNLDIEADLGIDSIKRVEILGSLKNLNVLQNATAVDSKIDTLAQLKTFGEIVNWLVSQNDRSVANGRPIESRPSIRQKELLSSDGTSKATLDQGNLERLTVELVEAPRLETPATLTVGGTVVITDDGEGLAELLKTRLAEFGVASEVIQLPGITESDCDPLVFSKRIAAIGRTRSAIGALVHLFPASARKNRDELEFHRRLRQELNGLFCLVKSIRPDFTPDASVFSATRMGGTFGSDGQIDEFFWPGHGAQAGFIKTLAREQPDWNCKAVDFESGVSNEVAVRALVAELAIRDGLVEVGYRQDRRITLSVVRAPLVRSSTQLGLNNQSVVLITGGARGITAEIAIELAQQFQPELVLVGRSPLVADPYPDIADERMLRTLLIEKLRQRVSKVTPAMVETELSAIQNIRAVQSNIAAMQAAGATVHYETVDVGNDTEFEALIDKLYEQHGNIDAVIHGAGVIEDKRILDKSIESFERVLRPKVRGAVTLSRKLRPAALKFVAFFSSVSARFGNQGQSDYAAANEILNKLAVWLNKQWKARVVSINWGPWKSGTGMVSKELANRFAEARVQLISVMAGRKAFVDEVLFGPKDQVEVLWGGPIPKHHGTTSVRPAISEKFPILTKSLGLQSIDQENNRSVIVLKTDPERYVFLQDHQLDNTPTMPMAMVLELAAEVAATIHPGKEVVRVSNLQVFRGVTYKTRQEKVLIIEANSKEIDGVLRMDIEVRGEQTNASIHYRAQVELASQFAVPYADHQTPIELVQPRALPILISEAYNSWLFHGPLFAGITEVEAIGQNGIIGWLQPSAAKDLFNPPTPYAWLIDPVLVDSALQLSLLWARFYLDQTPLPARLAHYHRFAAAPAGPILCHMSIQHVQPFVRADVKFFDEKDRLIGFIESVEGTLSKALNRLGGGKQ